MQPGIISYLIAAQEGDEDAESVWREKQNAADLDADYHEAPDAE